MKLFGSFAPLISLLLLQYVITFGWALTAKDILPEDVTKLWDSVDIWAEVPTLGDAARTFAHKTLEEASETSIEARSHILDLQSNIETLLNSVKDFRETNTHLDFERISADLSRELDEAFHSFPPSEQPATREQREKRSREFLRLLREVMIRVLVSAGVSQDKAEEITDAILQPIE